MLVSMFDDSDKPLEGREYLDESDLDESQTCLIPCPSCGAMVYEDSPQCPRCHEWLPPDSADWRKSPRWYVRAGLWLARAWVQTWLVWLLLSLAGIIAWIVQQNR
jgi:hypothetical protein